MWIACGIGVAPFLGWLTTDGVDEIDRVDLFYSNATDADAVFLPDLVAAAAVPTWGAVALIVLRAVRGIRRW